MTTVAVDDQVVMAALAAGFSDLEDALQYCAALSVPAIELLVTRNGKEFARSTIPVVTPQVALTRL